MGAKPGPSRAVKLYFGWVAFSLVGSLISRVGALDPGPIAPVASMLTLATGVYAAFSPWVRRAGPRAVRALAAVLALGAVSEIVGLATGYPFGPYAYTERWWPTVPLGSLGPFPLLLPWAWLLMAGGCYFTLAGRLRGQWPVYREWVVPACLAAGIDFLMEPVMVDVLRYWEWRGVPVVIVFGGRWTLPGPFPGGADWLNPFGWIAVAALAGWVLQRAARDEDLTDRSPALVLAGHCVLTFGIGLIGLLPSK